MPRLHAGQHYTGTGCLCSCHFDGGSSHDDKKCAAIAKSERDAAKAADVVDLTPTQAKAGSPAVAHTFSTPFGQTSRFTR